VLFPKGCPRNPSLPVNACKPLTRSASLFSQKAAPSRSSGIFRPLMMVLSRNSLSCSRKSWGIQSTPSNLSSEGCLSYREISRQDRLGLRFKE
jgi:hypothetical protein